MIPLYQVLRWLGGPYSYNPIREDMEWQCYDNQVNRLLVSRNWWRLFAWFSTLMWLLTLWLAATGKLGSPLK